MANLPKASTNRVYLAGRFERQVELREIRLRLQQLGLSVKARWLDLNVVGRPAPTDPEWHAWAQQCAEADIADINQADAFLLDTTDARSGGGMHWESGYAYARGTPIYVVGPRTHVFHSLKNVMHFASWDRFVEYWSRP